MKTILFLTLSLIALGTFAQSQKIDISEILTEKREAINNNQIFIQKNGSFQVMTLFNFYKFDSNGKSLGKPERNLMETDALDSYNGGKTKGFDLTTDTYYKYDGKGKVSFCRLHSEKPNELIEINLPELKKLSDDAHPGVDIKFLDKNNVRMAFAFNGRSANSHGSLKTEKGKTSSFVRYLKINTQTKQVEESYHFIDKIEGNTKEFNDVNLNIAIIDEKRLSLSLFVGTSKGYVPTIVKGRCEMWEINLESKQDTKLGSVSVDEKQDASFYRFALEDSAYVLTWTKKSKGMDGYSLHGEFGSFKNGEWMTETIDFPQDKISIVSGEPSFIASYTTKFGQTYRFLHVHVPPSNRGEQSKDYLVLHDGDDIELRVLGENLYAFDFYYQDGQTWRNILLDQGISEKTIEALSTKLLEPSKISYTFVGTGILGRKIENEFFIIHYDWRGTLGKPDYQIELVRLDIE